MARDTDLDRHPATRRFVELGFKSICSVPLITRGRTFGTLALSRMTDDEWTREDIEFLSQVASQAAIAVDNSLAYRELSEMKERLATEKFYLEDEIRLDHNIGNMVGEGPAFQSILKSVQIVASTDSTVLILGETGTEKELVARAIHELSGRKKGSFIRVYCAAIPASLLESELIGHEKGSFTGASAQKIGRLELDHHGTLFLDEIGGMPLGLKPKLEALTRYDWPGNIRELQNLIERSVILTSGSTLHVAMPEFMEKSAPALLHSRSSKTSQPAERERIIRALEEANGQVGGLNGAAARLGVKRTTLQSRIRKYKIARQYR